MTPPADPEGVFSWRPGVTRDRLAAIGGALVRIGLFILLFIAMAPWLGMLAGAVLAGWFLLHIVERRPLSDLGFALKREEVARSGLGLLIGVAALGLAVLPAVAVGALRFAGDAGNGAAWLSGVAGFFAVLLVPAAAEEALFRGYPFQKLVEGFGAIAATLVASAAFAVAHAGNPSVNGVALLNIFLAGVVLSLAYLRTRSLWFATAVHLGWNWAMAGLLDLPVSGLELFDAPLYEPVDRGPAWLTGGAFGPEAGLTGVFGLLIMLGAVLKTKRQKTNGEHQ